MQGADSDVKLLKMIYDRGRTVRIEGGVDHRPYKRLVVLGWVSGQMISAESVRYDVTSLGLRVIAEYMRD